MGRFGFYYGWKCLLSTINAYKYTKSTEAWYQFSNDISKAQKIEVYSQDKKIGEFNPTKQSAKKVLGDGLCDQWINKKILQKKIR